MVWLNPLAVFAIAAVAAPIVIHLLIQRRAERFPFPTLRFLQPTRLASIRRHLLDDLPLLAVRAAIVAAAGAALAGPVLITPARRQAWDRRVVRAIATDSPGTELAASRRASAVAAEQSRPLRQQTFQDSSLADAIRRAIVWLDTAPPARREIVIASTLAIGSVSDKDIAAIPTDVGVRVERLGALPATRTVPAGSVLTKDGTRAREVIFSGADTSLREMPATDPGAWPIDIESSDAERAAIQAAVDAVLSQQVWAAPAGRRARLVLVPPAGGRSASDVVETSRVAPITQAWIGEAVARIAGDADVRAAGLRITSGLTDARFAAPPWERLGSALDGRPLAVAAGSASGLIVASAAPASDLVTPLLLRSIANSLVPAFDAQRFEIVPIDDAVLRRWARPARPVVSPRLDTLDADDRRWLWVAVLCLMVLELWVRRDRPLAAAGQLPIEDARVA